MATGPAAALKIVDRLVAKGTLSRSHLLPSIKGELLTKLRRTDEACLQRPHPTRRHRQLA